MGTINLRWPTGKQQSDILIALREAGEDGLPVWKIKNSVNVGGLGVSQYNARIKELRSFGWIIENVKPGLFVLEKWQRNIGRKTIEKMKIIQPVLFDY